MDDPDGHAYSPRVDTARQRIAGPRPSQTTWSAPTAPLAVVARTPGLGLHFQDDALDGHDSHRVARVNRSGPIRTRAPQRIAHAHDAVGVDVGFGATHLTDELV